MKFLISSATSIVVFGIAYAIACGVASLSHTLEVDDYQTIAICLTAGWMFGNDAAKRARSAGL